MPDDKHAIACSKMQKPRKVFDIIKARVKGTELEQYASKIRENSPSTTDDGHHFSGRSKTASKTTTFATAHDTPSKAPRPANWRVKHDKFIQMVRAARQPIGGAGGDSAATGGGNYHHVVSEPDPDFVQCEYCSRRFQKDTAARHIPFCKESQQKKMYRTTAMRPGAGGSGGAAAGAGGALSREEMVKKRVAYKPPTPRTKPKQ
ncbi:Zinc finger C2HC domain-containing protein 1A [Geranomyces michiganensis]|nr:Zinc finger C2HC domain-containing protein 1A [Geranomyces michiganensis]